MSFESTQNRSLTYSEDPLNKHCEVLGLDYGKIRNDPSFLSSYFRVFRKAHVVLRCWDFFPCDSTSIPTLQNDMFKNDALKV